jgi:hypothetical protein
MQSNEEEYFATAPGPLGACSCIRVFTTQMGFVTVDTVTPAITADAVCTNAFSSWKNRVNKFCLQYAYV